MDGDYGSDAWRGTATSALALVCWIALIGCTDRSIVFAAMLADDSSQELYSIRADGSDLSRLTSTDGEDEYAPRWSPDHTQVAYLIDAQMFVRQVGGDDAALVAHEVGRGSRGLDAPAWSPDGTQIIYCYPREPDWVDLGEEMVDESYATSLHRVNADGTGDVDLSYHDRTLTFPAWSDDDQVAFLISDDCPDCPGGWEYMGLVRADGTGLEEIVFSTDDTDVIPREDLDWHPDSKRLAYTGAGIVVADILGTERTLVLDEGSMPRWSPDGTRIAYLGDDGIHVMNANGSGDSLIYEAQGIVGIDW
jgi:Tol biopolymer transport system component